MIAKDLKRFFKVGMQVLHVANLCPVKQRQWKVKESITMQLMDKGIPNQTAKMMKRPTLLKSSQNGTEGLNSGLFGKNRQQQPKAGQRENELPQLCAEKQKLKKTNK